MSCSQAYSVSSLVLLFSLIHFLIYVLFERRIQRLSLALISDNEWKANEAERILIVPNHLFTSTNGFVGFLYIFFR